MHTDGQVRSRHVNSFHARCGNTMNKALKAFGGHFNVMQVSIQLVPQ